MGLTSMDLTGVVVQMKKYCHGKDSTIFLSLTYPW